MPTFDAVCKPNLVELRNAVEQTNKEIGTRFDFKGSDARVEQSDKALVAYADSDFQLGQVRDVLLGKMTKRNVDVRFLDHGKVEKIGGDKVKQTLTVRNGVPQDAGPMALFYRKDLFTKNNIPVPTTWDEYAADAVKIRALGGYITNFSQSDVNQFAGLVWQAGGSWFSNDGTSWNVNLTSPESTKVANYWQDLISKNLVSSVPPWTSEWNNAYNTGSDWTWVSAVWGANSISSGAPATAGDWAVAPMPQWQAGQAVAGDWGGSSTAVFKGSKHVYEAAKFALWLNTSDEALTLLNKAANLYPATTAGAKLPALAAGVPFFGGQAIYDVFAKASSEVSPTFTWGPTMTQVYADASDGFKAAVSGKGTLLDALTSTQASTIATLKSQSIPVKG